MSPERPTARAHRALAAVLRPGDLAIDATAGNGHDTVFLAEHVGETGRILAFDIQPEAIAATRARITDGGLASRVTLLLASHAAMAEHAAPGSAAAIVFNLGYLPGADHTIITRTPETLAALGQAFTILKPGGLLAIVCYPGHPGGDEESAAVLEWSTCHSPEVIRREDTLRPAPFLILVQKTRHPTGSRA